MLEDAQRALRVWVDPAPSTTEMLNKWEDSKKAAESQDAQDVADVFTAAKAAAIQAVEKEQSSAASVSFGKVAEALAGMKKELDSPERPILILADTLVYVTDKSRLLIPHKLKKDHVFMRYLVGCEPMIMTGAFDPKVPRNTHPAELLRLGYYTFETNDRDWPHMIVRRNDLRVEGKK